MKQVIQIESFNPYERIFPNRKVITLDTLILMKTLRQQGFEVQILPLDNRPVQYIFRKGLREFLSDPINMLIIGIPISLIINIISNYVQKALDKSTEKKLNPNRHVIVINDRSTNIFYNYEGDILLEKDLNERAKALRETQLQFEKEFKKKAPQGLPPTPIFYEHKPDVVGWCRLQIDTKGLLVEEGQIVKKEIKQKIEKGKIKGLSVTGIATETQCSVCNGDFVACLHFGENVTNTIKKADFVEVSLVKTPVNKECLVSLK